MDGGLEQLIRTVEIVLDFRFVFDAYVLCSSPPSIFTLPLRFASFIRFAGRFLRRLARPLFFVVMLWLCSGYAVVMLWLCCGCAVVGGGAPCWFIEHRYPSQGGGTPLISPLLSPLSHLRTVLYYTSQVL